MLLIISFLQDFLSLVCKLEDGDESLRISGILGVLRSEWSLLATESMFEEWIMFSTHSLAPLLFRETMNVCDLGCLHMPLLSLLSDSLPTHGLQHARLPWPSLSPGVCSDSWPLSWWCYLTISSSATLFSFCLKSFPASGSSPVSWPFTSDGPSVGTSASVPPVNIQDCLMINYVTRW